jgi:hypothetical protein
VPEGVRGPGPVARREPAARSAPLALASQDQHLGASAPVPYRLPSCTPPADLGSHPLSLPTHQAAGTDDDPYAFMPKPEENNKVP